MSTCALELASHASNAVACPLVRSLLASHASNADLMAILAEQGFNPKKVSEALAIEIPRNQIGEDLREYNRMLQAKSNGLLPVQEWDKVEIATLRTSTTSAVLRCCKIGGGRTPHDHFRTATRPSATDMVPVYEINEIDYK